MKMKHFPLVMVCGVVVLCSDTQAQTSRRKRAANRLTDSVMLARAYLNGHMGKAYDPQKAYQIFSSLAAAGNGKATNALGVMYAKGMGVQADASRALTYYTQAAGLGYKNALVNAAQMYAAGQGTNQNFTKAFELYRQAAQNDIADAKFYMAYYYYKGLAGRQSYEEAYRLFSELAQQDHATAMYFTALCLRNGYGTTRNIEAARNWLLKAAAKGDRQAKEELGISTPENPETPIEFPVKSMVFDALTKTNSDYTRIRHNATVEDLPGSYTGYAIRYDWSGRHIVEYWPITLSVTAKGEEVSGVYDDGDGKINIQGRLSAQGLSFENTSFVKSDHYTPKPALKEFRNAKLNVVAIADSTYILGNLQLYVPFRKEPEKPMVIYVKAVNKNTTITKSLKMAVFPNPATNKANIQFTLPAAAQTQLIVVDMEGKIVYTENAGMLLPGTYQRNLDVSRFQTGMYQIKINAGGQSQVSKFIKQ
jgi:uncharacterized protein